MEIILTFVWMLAESSSDNSLLILLLGPLSGVAFYGLQYARYRNHDKSYQYENKTEIKVSNIDNTDRMIGKNNGTRDSKIANHHKSSNPRKRVKPLA